MSQVSSRTVENAMAGAVAGLKVSVDEEEGQGKASGSPKLRAASATAMNSLGSCLMYMLCSTCMVLANKSLASSVRLQAPLTLLLMQNSVAVCLCEACKLVGVVEYDDFRRAVAYQWLPVNVCFILMLSTSFIAMRYLSVPMITVFKQLANLLTVSGEFYFFGKTATRGVIASLATMILGALLAADKDVAFDLAGYCWQTANCVATSSYVLYLKHATSTITLGKFGMVFYNNLLSLPLLAALALANGELDTVRRAAAAGDLDAAFFAFNAVAGAIGFLLNLASVWCVSATSATTYAVVGALNKIPVTFFGIFLFDTTISHDMAKYIALSFLGGFMYSFEMIRSRK